jgi:hypothetical protein
VAIGVEEIHDTLTATQDRENALGPLWRLLVEQVELVLYGYVETGGNRVDELVEGSRLRYGGLETG